MTYSVNSHQCSFAYLETSSTVGVRVPRTKTIKSKITASLPIFRVVASLAYLVPGISPIAGLLDYLIEGYDVRVLSLSRETFLIVCAIRVFKITKGSRAEAPGRRKSC